MMPEFWQFPTVSMGLGPINAIYQAMTNKYLANRGIKENDSHVWAFLGDGEMDEVESRGQLQVAANEGLDNLTFVINCNLQRLDGPVRGNGKIIQELESFFRGAGWNVIKVVWGREWDDLLARDTDGALLNLMNVTPDGDFQTFKAESGAYVRENFFGRDERALALVKDYSDDDIWRLRRGGHDYRKVYAAYKAAMEHKGQPTVILAKTVKGYGLGPHFEGRNATHQMKKMTLDDLKLFRDTMHIPITDAQLEADPYRPPYYNPGPGDETIQYMLERRRELGGFLPERRTTHVGLNLPEDKDYALPKKGSGNQEVATTMALVRMIKDLMRVKGFGERIVPIIPRRGAHVRHGRVFPDREDLQPERAELHGGRPGAAARLQGEPAGPDHARRHQRGRSRSRLHRDVDLVLDARPAADPDLHLLLDVRLPAHRRRVLGRRRQMGRGFIIGAPQDAPR